LEHTSGKKVARNERIVPFSTTDFCLSRQKLCIL